MRNEPVTVLVTFQRMGASGFENTLMSEFGALVAANESSVTLPSSESVSLPVRIEIGMFVPSRTVPVSNAGRTTDVTRGAIVVSAI
jgi:hypothetical protein